MPSGVSATRGGPAELSPTQGLFQGRDAVRKSGLGDPERGSGAGEGAEVRRSTRVVELRDGDRVAIHFRYGRHE